MDSQAAEFSETLMDGAVFRNIFGGSLMAVLQSRNCMLGHLWDGEPLSGRWFVSEKFDGQRALWDGRKLVSRYGNTIWAPRSWTDRLPPMALDGELWMGRGQWQMLRTVVSGQQAATNRGWDCVWYVVFDIPWTTHLFSETVARLREVAKTGISPVAVPEWTVVENPASSLLEAKAFSIVEGGGEGIMLRADCPWTPCRTRQLLKVKPVRTGTGTVVGTRDGKGRLSGMIGSLAVRVDGTGIVVHVSGLTDEQRKQNDWIGRVVSFLYRELSDAGVPKEPRYSGTLA